MSRSDGPPVEWYQCEVAWRHPQAGGRACPPPGPRYATVARLAADPADEAFSVVVRLDRKPAEFALLFPENFPDKIAQFAPGTGLVLMDGPQEVADVTCLIGASRPVAAAT